MANEKQDKAKRIIEAGLAPHMAQVPRFGVQGILRAPGQATPGPAGTRRGLNVQGMKLTPRGLEVQFGDDVVVVGQGSWTYVVEAAE